MVAPVLGKVFFSVASLATVFSLATLLLYVLGAALAAEMGSVQLLYIPRTIPELRSMVRMIGSHRSPLLFTVFSITYLYKQTFAIPGSMFLNILAGALFGVWVGTPLVSLLSATGASLCYTLSKLAGHQLVEYCLTHRVSAIKEKVILTLSSTIWLVALIMTISQLKSNSSHSLLMLLVSMRLFPGTPNWLLNLTAPIVGISLPLFFASVLIGLLPYNLICVHAGQTLFHLDVTELMNPTTYMTFILLAFSALALSALMYRST